MATWRATLPIARCADHPVPIVSAAASVTAARAAAADRHRHHLRLAVDTAAVPRADGRLPRRRRIRPVRAHPARMDRRTTSRRRRPTARRLPELLATRQARKRIGRANNSWPADASAVAAGLLDAMETARCDCVNLQACMFLASLVSWLASRYAALATKSSRSSGSEHGRPGRTHADVVFEASAHRTDFSPG